MRWLLFFVILTIVFGILLNEDLKIPALSWVGHLPGDLIIHKSGIEIYLPLTSSLLVSLLFSLIIAALKSRFDA